MTIPPGSRLNIESAGVPYWWEAAPPYETTQRDLPSHGDVVVIGSGWTGLSAALTLARAGRDVLVVEANTPGSGGSTRNAGFFGNSLRARLSKLIGEHGRSVAIELAAGALHAFEFTKTLIEREQIQCDLEDLGRLTCAYRQSDYDTLARESELVNQVLGIETRMLSASELQDEIGTDQYHGAELTASSFCMHPGKYLAGLLERCLSAGVRVVDKTTVIGLNRSQKEVITTRGTINAREILIATNAYTTDFIPELKRKLIPTGANVIATEALDTATMQQVFRRPRLGIDTRRIYRAFRPSPDGRRILFAGRSRDPGRGPRRNAAIMRRQMIDLFPSLRDVEITHSWGGYVAFTFDYLPHLGQIDGIYYAMGLNASGASMAPYLGHQIALSMLGQRDEGGLFDRFKFQSRPLYTGEPWFLPIVLTFYRLMDRLGY